MDDPALDRDGARRCEQINPPNAGVKPKSIDRPLGQPYPFTTIGPDVVIAVDHPDQEETGL